MKIVIFPLILFLATVAGNDNNSIDLSSVTVCATLNNVYKTFANIWEVYNEFKTTGQLWLPVATSACHVTQIDCKTLSPVCAVTGGNFFKTFPNQCLLEAEQKATGTAWTVVFNGICSTNPADGFGAPVSQTGAKNDKNGGKFQPKPLDHIPLTISDAVASPDLSPIEPSYPPTSINSEPEVASQQSNEKKSEPVQSCSSDVSKQYNSAPESQPSSTYSAPPSIPYNYAKSSSQVQSISASSLTNIAELPAKPVVPPNYGNFLQYAAPANAGQAQSIAREYTNRNSAQVAKTYQLPTKDQPKEASYSPIYPILSPIPSNYNQNSAQEKPIPTPMDSFSSPAVKAIQPLHTNSLISQSSDKFNQLSGEKKPQQNPLSSNSYSQPASPISERYNIVSKPKSSPDYPTSYPNPNINNNSPIPGYNKLIRNPQSIPIPSTPAQYSVPQQPEKSPSPSYVLPSYDAAPQRLSGYYKSSQDPKPSEPIPPPPAMTASYNQDSQQSQPPEAPMPYSEGVPPSQPSPASSSESQKPSPSPVKSNYDKNSPQSQPQQTSSSSGKYNSPQPSVNYAAPSYISGDSNQASQQSQPQEAPMSYSAGVKPYVVSGNYNSNQESQPAPASPIPSAQVAQPSVNYAASSFFPAYYNQASQQSQPQEATLPFSEIVPPSAIPVYYSSVLESKPSPAFQTPSNCNQMPAQAQSVEDTLTPSDSPSKDVALPSASQKPLPSPDYGYDQNPLQSPPQQKSPPSRNYNSAQPSVNYAAPSHIPGDNNQAFQQSQPQEATLPFSEIVPPSAVPVHYSSVQESQPSPASPSESQKPLPSPGYGISSPVKSNCDQNSPQSQPQQTSSHSRKYNSPQPSVNYAAPLYIPEDNNQASQQSQPQEATLPFSEIVPPSAVPVYYSSVQESQPSPASPTSNCNQVPAYAQNVDDTLTPSVSPSNDVALPSESKKPLTSPGYGYDQNPLQSPLQQKSPPRNYNSPKAAQPSVNYAAPSYSSAYYNQASQQSQPQEAPMPYSAAVQPSGVPGNYNSNQESEPAPASPTSSTQVAQPSVNYAAPSYSSAYYSQASQQSQPQEAPMPYSAGVQPSAVPGNYNSNQESQPGPASPTSSTQPSVNYAAPSNSPGNYNQPSQQSQPQEAPMPYSNQESQPAPASTKSSTQVAQPSVNYAAPSNIPGYYNQPSQQSQPQEAPMPYSADVQPSAVPGNYNSNKKSQPAPASPTPSNCNQIPAYAQNVDGALTPSDSPFESQKPLPSPGYPMKSNYDQNSEQYQPQKPSPPSKNYNSVQAAQPSINYFAPSLSPAYYYQVSPQSNLPSLSPVPNNAAVGYNQAPGQLISYDATSSDTPGDNILVQQLQSSSNYPAPSSSYGQGYAQAEDEQYPSPPDSGLYSTAQKLKPSPEYRAPSSVPSNYGKYSSQTQPKQELSLPYVPASDYVALAPDSGLYSSAQQSQSSQKYPAPYSVPPTLSPCDRLSDGAASSPGSLNYNSVQEPLPSIKYSEPAPIPANPDQYSVQPQSEPKPLTAYNNAPSPSAEAVEEPQPSPNPNYSNYVPFPIPSNYNTAPKPQPSPTYPAPSPNSLHITPSSRMEQSSQSSQDAASLSLYGNYNSVQKPQPSQPQPSPVFSSYGSAVQEAAPSATISAASYSSPSADVEESPEINNLSQNAAQVPRSSRQGYEGASSAYPSSPTDAAQSSPPSNSYVEQNSDAQYSQQKTEQKYQQSSNSYSPSSQQSSPGSYLPSNSEQSAPNAIPCSNTQTYNLHTQSQISSDISVTSDEPNNYYAKEPETNLLNQNSDTKKSETCDGAGKSSQGMQDEAQTIYNGVVYQGPYYYEPKYKHINFGNFNFLPPQSSPPVSAPTAEPFLAPANPSANVPETQYPEYNMNPFELLLKQLQYIASKNGESSY